eukprot:jgi/Ulvmu1/10386/UM061_0070.1
MKAMYIKSLHVFPVKSCKGLSLTSVHAGRTGLELDRQWMLVKQKDMSFVTQRTHPHMSQIEVSISGDMQSKDTTLQPTQSPGDQHTHHVIGPADFANGHLQLQYLVDSSLGPMQVPIRPPISLAGQTDPDNTPSGSGMVQAKVWEWSGDVWDEGDAAAEWFSTALGDPVRLVRYVGGLATPDDDSSTIRDVSAEYAPGHETAFADGFPILLATEASRRHMEEAAGISIEIERFRPNVVVAGDGMEPFAEDDWSVVSTGRGEQGKDLTCRLVKPCTRCTIPDINPATGVTKGRETFLALSKLRSGKVLREEKAVYDRPEWKNRTFFGWNVVVDGTGMLSVGDAVTLVETRA